MAIVIWTTTPWTLPANEAVALRDEYEYVLVDFDQGGVRRRIVVAEGLASDCLARYGATDVRELATFAGELLEGLKLRHPFQDRLVPVILGDHVTLEAGTGAVHTAPAHGQDDYIVGRRYGLPVVNPVLGDGRFQADVPLVGGMKLDDASKLIIETLQASGDLLHHAAIAAQLSALLAPQDAGDLPRHAAVVHLHGAEGTARQYAARHPQGAVDSGLGPAAHRRHDRDPSGLVHLAPAHLGRADRAVHAQRNRPAASAHAGADRSGGRSAWRRAASTPGSTWMRRSCWATTRRTIARSPTSWTCGPIRA